MPLYVFQCLRCDKELEEFCSYEEANTKKCDCGGDTKIKITTARVIPRMKKLRTLKWIKERGL